MKPMQIIELEGDWNADTAKRTRISCRGLVMKEDKLLLSYETKTGLWMIPGGGLEEGETDVDCCVREVGEETGVLVEPSLPQLEIAEKAIDATYRFFESINIPMHLREVGIDDSRLDEMAHHIAVNEGLENAYAPLTEQDIKEILVESL